MSSASRLALLLALAACAPRGTLRRAPMRSPPPRSEVPVSVHGLFPGAEGFTVVLHGRLEENEERFLPIFVGPAEGMAIGHPLAGVEPPRPMTHDLLLDAVELLDAQVEGVAVTSLAGGTFIGEVRLRTRAGEERRLDARPSDAIALALRAGAPIAVSRALLERAGLTRPEEATESQPATAPAEEEEGRPLRRVPTSRPGIGP